MSLFADSFRRLGSVILTFATLEAFTMDSSGSETVLAKSPIVLADQQVKFRLAAPLADRVKLRGINRQLIDMHKDAGVSGGANTVYFWRLQNHLS